MKLFTAATTISCIAAIGAIFGTAAMAGDWNKKTVVTFSGPVEIPGVHLTGWAVLPAGTYVFKILDSQSDRHIVQIFSRDEATVYATILAVPNYRLKATDKTVITFRERPSGEPEALRAWFYPGANWGEEFVYPKAKAIELAKETHTPVLFTPAELPLEAVEPIKTADAPVVMQLKRAPIMAIKPTGEEAPMLEVVTPPPARMETAATNTASNNTAGNNTAPDTTLPATAGSLPLFALFGMLALAAALVLRMTERRVQKRER